MILFARALLAVAFLVVSALPAEAARIGVMSNRYFNESATDFNGHLAGHTFVPIDVSSTVPTLASLNTYDALLVFEDTRFANATAVGNLAAAFAGTGRAVVLGTFYDQDRSDAGGVGWGALETLDPNTTDGFGTPNSLRTLAASGITAHPLTTGVTSLFANSFSGGNQAKPGTTVVATWTQNNARGLPDPAIAYRVTGAACVIQIGVVPHYAALGTFGTNFGGDYYRVWQNAFDFAGRGCVTSVSAIPTLSDLALAMLVLVLGFAGWRERVGARR